MMKTWVSKWGDSLAISPPPPERGPWVGVDLTPQSGGEQGGHRPAPVISPWICHERSKLTVVCPITSDTRAMAVEGHAAEGLVVAGAVLVDRVRSIDRAARRLHHAGAAPQSVVAEVQAELAALLGTHT